MIQWELCKKLKFDNTNKWYMHNPESLLENETHKLLWDFEIQTDHLISARWPHLIMIYKKERTRRILNFAVPADHRVKLKECEKNDKYLDLAWEWKKPVDHESDGYTNCNWCSWYNHQRTGTKTEGHGNNGTGGDCPNYSIVEIGHNTPKNQGNLRRLAVAQTPVEDYQLKLTQKHSRRKIIIICNWVSSSEDLRNVENPFLPLPPGPFWPRNEAHVWVSSMGQMDLFINYSYQRGIYDVIQQSWNYLH